MTAVDWQSDTRGNENDNNNGNENGAAEAGAAAVHPTSAMGDP